ncbi:MAG: tetratricopeptide repeat protein [Pyrinomonadaceae bacterium]|nr:tetratricopeptide repeat protein [Pyrinomonadaceae bacterium]
MIGQVVSHYRLVSVLGEGGMGVVYVAEDTHLRRRVAVKFPAAAISDKPHFRARILREARAVSALNHPHIATIYDYGETDEGQPFIVMELVSGQTLSDLLHTNDLTLVRAVEIITDVAEALAEAHRHGIIHRDIKPSNVMINERGEVKVLDFGLAKQIDTQPGGVTTSGLRTQLATQTHSGAVVGTPLYLSPEQAMCAPVDGRSDLFALGAVLYECIAGRPAFSGGGVLEIAAQVLHVDPSPPSKFNPRVLPELDRITLRALAKERAERYQTADEMVADLRAVHAKLSGIDNAPTRRLILPPETLRTNASATLSALRRRLSPLTFFVALMVVLLTSLFVMRWWHPVPYKPTPEARSFYDAGVDHLRNGAYYQASKALERAVNLDDKFVLAHARLAEAWTELDYTDKAKDELLRVSELVSDRSALPPEEAHYLEAINATVTRRFAQAIEFYRKIAELSPDQPQVYADLGRAHEKSDDIKQAIETYEEATKRGPQYPTGFLQLGILYGRQQNFEKARAAFSRAESIYNDLTNIEGQTEVFYQRGFLFNKVNKLPEARTQLQRALDMARNSRNEYQEIKTLLQLISLSDTEGDTTQAKQYALQGIDLARARGMHYLEGRGLIDLGNVFFRSGEHDEAEKYFTQALELAQRRKGSRNEAGALFSLGSLRIQQGDGDTDEGLRNVEQALAFYNQGGYRKEVSQALTLIGRANQEKGNYDAALQAFKQQLQLAEQVGDPSQRTSALSEIGNLFISQERYPDALRSFEESHAINIDLRDQLYIGYSLADRGRALWQLGRYEDARAVLGEASAIASRPAASYKELSALIHLIYAQMRLSERRFSEAKIKSEEAISLAGTRYKTISIEARRTLGLTQALSGASRVGMSSCKQAVEMATRTNNPWLLSGALLALAEAMLEDGNAQTALETATRAQATFASSGQQESEWRTWLIAARASQSVGDYQAAREYLTRAENLLAQLHQRWGPEAFGTYLNRPDVQVCRKHLSKISVAVH